MKHLYTLAAILFIGATTWAQVDLEDTKGTPSRPGLSADTHTERATPFWTEDFSGGFPSDWVIIDSSGICPWSYSNDGSWGFWSTTGETSGDNPMSSTTAGNGFLICDPDSANHFNYGQPSGSTYQYLASYFGTSAIDCSGHASVLLSFEQSYRYNNSVPMWVQVSTDSTNWTAFNVAGGLSNNTASADPDVEILNLSTIAANQATVYLRFGWSARVYFWMIDDIALSEADPNDVSIEEGYWGTGNFQAQFYKIPTDQISPVTFYGPLSNNTGNAMTDTYFDVDVDNGGSVFSGTSNLIPLAATEVDTAISTTDWTPSAVGNYDVTFTADITGLTDGNLTNNVSVDAVEITDGIYGLDNLDAGLTGWDGGISNFSGNTGNPFGIGNYYEVINDGQIQCIEIGITDDAQNEGNLIYGAVYYWDGGAWAYLDQTADYQIMAADLENTVSLSFATPVAVLAGQELVVVASHYGGNDVEFMMAQTVPNQMVWGYDGTQSWFWLTAPKAIVVRPNFNDACLGGIGFDENEISNSFTVYPNPAVDNMNISIELGQAADVMINIFDINGKLIYSGTKISYTEGTHAMTINTESFAAGSYTVEVQINDTKERQLIVVQ